MNTYETIWDSLARRDAMTNVYGGPDRKTKQREFEKGGQVQAEILHQFISSEDVILDVGCGPGRIEKYLAPHCGQLYAADVSQKMLDLAAERLSELDNVYLQKLDGQSLNLFADNFFDFVWCMLVLQHMEKEEAFVYLCEMFRVLKPGGRVFLQFPNILSEFYFENSFLRYVEGEDRSPARVRPYSTIEVERFMRAAGFVDLNICEGTNSLLNPHEISVVARKPMTEKGESSIKENRLQGMSGDIIEIKDPEINVEAIMNQIRANIAEKRVDSIGTDEALDNKHLFVEPYLSDRGWITRKGPLAYLRKKAHELVLFYVNQLASRINRFRSQVLQTTDRLTKEVEKCARQGKVDTLESEVQRLSQRVAALESRLESALQEGKQ